MHSIELESLNIMKLNYTEKKTQNRFTRKLDVNLTIYGNN